MTLSAARLVSIAGHPAVLMTLAALVASPGANVLPIVVATVACGLGVLGYSYYKAQRGDWGHIDASSIGERTQLNFHVGLGLLGAAGVLALTSLHVGVSIAVALAALIVLAGHLLRSLAKISLHVAFAVFAAFIAWPNNLAAAALLVAALAVGWSRLVLRRHVGRDLFWGAAVGTVAGCIFQAVMSSLDA